MKKPTKAQLTSTVTSQAVLIESYRETLGVVRESLEDLRAVASKGKKVVRVSKSIKWAHFILATGLSVIFYFGGNVDASLISGILAITTINWK